MSLDGQLVFGVSVNNVTGITGKSYELHDLLRAAREAEAMGFDAVWVHDGMLGRRTTAAYDPVAVLCAVAAQTRSIRLCTGILIPHIRNPVHLAQQWATLYEVSQGRAILGAGSGGGRSRIHLRQYGALAALQHEDHLDPNYMFEKRARLFGECLHVIRRLWREDKVSHEAEFYRISEITLGHARPANPPPILVAAGIYVPKDVKGAHFPIWNEKVAGTFMMGQTVTRHVIDYGDGWLTNQCTPEELEQKWAELMDGAEKKFPGRKYVKALNCFMHVDEDSRKAWQGVKDHLADFHGPPIPDDLVDRWGAWGSGQAIAEKIQKFIDRGVSIFQFVVACPDQFGMMKRIADQVLPRLKRG